MRTVAWFSAGAASTCATRLAVDVDPATVVAYCDPGSEHPDTLRYIADVERWLGTQVLFLRSDKYEDTWDVFRKTRYLVGPSGARCTTELKKLVRRDFQHEDDTQVFGFTWEERKRADCHAMVAEAGIEQHAMYRLGFSNANCIACPKGGMSYWNRVRVHFPDEFNRMAAVERELNIAVNREEKRIDGKRVSFPVFLDELDPDRGRGEVEPEIECGVLCPTQMTFDDVGTEGPLDEFEQHLLDLVDAATDALTARANPQATDVTP